MNINRFLENARRSDVIGYNIWTMGKTNFRKPLDHTIVPEKWDPPALGLSGQAAIAHHLDVTDLIAPKIFLNGAEQEFTVMRNHWTPAYMDTYYRSKPSGDYKLSGLIAVRETKCFTEDDTFVSHLTVYNDDNVPAEISIQLTLPFDTLSDGLYTVSAKIMPGGLNKAMTLKGYAAAQATVCRFTLPAGGRKTLRYGFAFDPQKERSAMIRLEQALAQEQPFARAEARFNRWMEENIPVLHTENTDMRKVYYYRSFLIKRAIHNPARLLPDSDFQGECVYESPFGYWFGSPIGLPIPLQIEEMKWLKNTDAIYSHIANWCAGPGTTKDYIQSTPMAIWQLYCQQKDTRILSDAYAACKEYTLKKAKEDPRVLPKTTGSWVTGAEYQPSFYQHTDPQWDWRNDNEGLKQGFSRTVLHRVDESVMYAANLTACANMAALLGEEADAAFFRETAEAVISEIRTKLWNEEKQFFFDVDTATGKQCDLAYCYDGFMPMMWDLVGDAYHGAFSKLESDSLYSDFSVLSVDKDCPMHWFDNCITGPIAATKADPHRYPCCWNGPVWPFAVSLVLNALGSASRHNQDLQKTWQRLFDGYTDLHFNMGDRSTPCICEHFRATDGMSFSPYAEYFHSEWIHLFMTYWAGIHIAEDAIGFSPITREDFRLEHVAIHGKLYRFVQQYTDGKLQRFFEAE